MITLTNVYFFVFLITALLLFYLIKPIQKYILLAASIAFYLLISSGSKVRLCALIFIMGMVTYLGAIFIEKTKGKIRGFILLISVLGLVSLLIVFKYAFNLVSLFGGLFHLNADFSFLDFIPIIGLSYYSLNAIGYLIEVYWSNQKAEKNIADMFLFVFYFPQIISGPITRFSLMQPQWSGKRQFNTDKFMHGVRRMLWGYFKKLVISERFALVVSTVYGDFSNYGFITIAGATLCYAVQLYTDFSGCMDIIMGTSMLFGIDLPENFRAPFFSETIQEFWQRWHITLGTWFKDYLMFPLQKSKGLQKLGKWSKKKVGKNFGKKVPFYCSMLVLWFLIGLWHGGTGYYFLASAVIPCVLLIISDISQPLFTKLVQKMHINSKSKGWILFRRIRTLLLICICWMVVCSGEVGRFITVIKHCFRHLIGGVSARDFMNISGLTIIDLAVMLCGLIILYFSDYLTDRGKSIFEIVDKRKYIIRLAVIYAEIIALFVFGMVGASSFIYFKF